MHTGHSRLHSTQLYFKSCTQDCDILHLQDDVGNCTGKMRHELHSKRYDRLDTERVCCWAIAGIQEVCDQCA